MAINPNMTYTENVNADLAKFEINAVCKKDIIYFDDFPLANYKIIFKSFEDKNLYKLVGYYKEIQGLEFIVK